MEFEITVADANTSATVRFWRKVDTSGECWEWLGKPNGSGYGRFRVGGAGSPDYHAHIVAWESVNGPRELGTTLHHTCPNRLCVRPDHLVQLDRSEHMVLHYAEIRREVCHEGHDLSDPENVYWWRGIRHCRPCRRMSDRRRLGIPYDRWILDR